MPLKPLSSAFDAQYHGRLFIRFAKRHSNDLFVIHCINNFYPQRIHNIKDPWMKLCSIQLLIFHLLMSHAAPFQIRKKRVLSTSQRLANTTKVNTTSTALAHSKAHCSLLARNRGTKKYGQPHVRQVRDQIQSELQPN